VVEQTNAFGQIVRQLQKLKRQLESDGVTARMDRSGGSRVTLQIPGLAGAITCRSNPADAHHLWYWLNNEPLTLAGDAQQAREAAKQLLQKLRAAATAQ
jgi:hypothetical protein